jgi:hypothetical protein
MVFVCAGRSGWRAANMAVTPAIRMPESMSGRFLPEKFPR